MAQSPLMPCVCSQAPGSNYCLDCEQYFCDHCKTVHRKIKLTQNHQFQSAKEAIPEVKSKCEEHDEAFNFYCTPCDVPVCGDCITGKHNGHKFKKIQDIFIDQIQQTKAILKPKIQQLTSKVQEVANGIHKFETETDSVIYQMKEDKEKLKLLIESHFDQFISEVLDKKGTELIKLRQIEDESQSVLVIAQSLEDRRKGLEEARQDAASIKKMKDLHDQIDLLDEGSELRFPSITYKTKKVDRKELVALMGDYQYSESKGEREIEKEKAKNKQREELIASAHACVFVNDSDAAVFIHPKRSALSTSTVGIYKRKDSSYRFVGRQNIDQKVVLNCFISKTLKYDTITETFHQFSVSRKIYSLTFEDKDNAGKFCQAVRSVLKDMQSH